MFEVTAICESPRCGRHDFKMLRRNVTRRSTSGQSYTIENVVCPQCSMWAKMTEIKKV